MGALSRGGHVGLTHSLWEGLGSSCTAPPAGSGHGNGDMETERKDPESCCLSIAQPRRRPRSTSSS